MPFCVAKSKLYPVTSEVQATKKYGVSGLLLSRRGWVSELLLVEPDTCQPLTSMAQDLANWPRQLGIEFKGPARPGQEK